MIMEHGDRTSEHQQTSRKVSLFNASSSIALFGLLLFATLGAASGALPNETDGSAEQFLPGIVSTLAIEDCGAFSPDGQAFVFTRRDGRWGAESGQAALYMIARADRGWTQPDRLPFSGEYDDADPYFAPDGRHLFFTSTRPLKGGVSGNQDVWVVERRGSTWGEPQHLGATVNSSGREYSPVVTADGSLYFASTREGGHGQGDLYVARRVGDAYGAPRNLGPVINSDKGEWNVFVPPDESFLIFEASERPTNRSPSGDLYISYRRPDGWKSPVPLLALNTPASELNARLFGGHLYFARSVTEPNGHHHASIFRVGAASVLPYDSPSQASEARALRQEVDVSSVRSPATFRVPLRPPR